MQKEVKPQWIADQGRSWSQKGADTAAHLFSYKPDICPLQHQKVKLPEYTLFVDTSLILPERTNKL